LHGARQERVGITSAGISLGHGSPQDRNDNWYFLNNNLGYCLSWFGRYAEATRIALQRLDKPQSAQCLQKPWGRAAGQGYSKGSCLAEAIRIWPRDGGTESLEELVSHKMEHLAYVGDIKRAQEMPRSG
jgi:hypothetical protein